MSEDSRRNSAVNVAAFLKVYHAHLQDLPLSTARRMYKGGVRSGEPMRTRIQAQEMLSKVPPSQRAGVNPQSATTHTQDYLGGKDASHVKAHSNGGSNDPYNIKWEDQGANRARGSRDMTLQEQAQLGMKWHVDNLTGAVKAGTKATPMGIAIGAATAAPFSLLTNALRVVRDEISPGQAAMATAKDTAMGGAVGGVSAFTITTVATACPPVALALTAASPLLLTVGVVGMVYEFFTILKDHQAEVEAYYESLTRQELANLQTIEAELVDQHQKNLDFLCNAEAIDQHLNSRSPEPGVAGALKRYQESRAIAASLGTLPEKNSQQLPRNSQKFLRLGH
ncbi:MAG: hypothetical protein HC835_09205 [Oscillatoriales cyanobacterium RM2_1_1]|nr:hypothetical protein [Oscillatoriales cyanobacterium SM2_3_0]NJO45784.1 hypothetical protein [Oscillatoriales cyanobacterium RM2_1_1]